MWAKQRVASRGLWDTRNEAITGSVYAHKIEGRDNAERQRAHDRAPRSDPYARQAPIEVAPSRRDQEDGRLSCASTTTLCAVHAKTGLGIEEDPGV